MVSGWPRKPLQAGRYADSVTGPPIPAKRPRTVVFSVTALAAAVTVAALIWTGAFRAEPTPEPLTVGTGPEGGVYFELGQTLQHLTQDSDVPLNAHESAASEVNLNSLAAGEIDVAFSTSDVARLAVSGSPPFDEPLPVRALGRLYEQPTHLVVPANSDIEELPDLAGRTVSVGAAGSGTRTQAHRLLRVAGLRGEGSLQKRSMDLMDSAEALESNEIDAFFWSGGLPSRAVTELAQRNPIRLVDLAEWTGPLGELGEGPYQEVPLPVDTYPGVPGVRSVGVSSLLMVRADMPHETAESLTAEVFASRSHLVEGHPVFRQLNERSAIFTQPVELHSGAVDYYRSAKPAHRPVEPSRPAE